MLSTMYKWCERGVLVLINGVINIALISIKTNEGFYDIMQYIVVSVTELNVTGQKWKSTFFVKMCNFGQVC